jgi:lipoprotein-anchoring transpeptidase ErfK/SrfK
MGQPGSAGCVRMTSDDVIWLFDRVEVGTPVLIRV